MNDYLLKFCIHKERRETEDKKASANVTIFSWRFLYIYKADWSASQKNDMYL
jgi:hypothetical protein